VSLLAIHLWLQQYAEAWLQFERFGRLVRCDIPAPKSSTAKV
jgi:hypothetical protein